MSVLELAKVDSDALFNDNDNDNDNDSDDDNDNDDDNNNERIIVS